LGSFDTGEQATAAYHFALERLRRGEPAKLEAREKSNPAEQRRLFIDRTVRFENDGERVIAIEPAQPESVFLLHNALKNLHPKVRQFVVAASNSGDLEEAALVAGLSQSQVAAVLPRLRVFSGATPA
jgi:hypothetical protein